MRVLVNALSVTNLSGRHVLLGHLSNLAAWSLGQHDFVVLFHDANRDICRDLGANVQWVEAPGFTAHWLGRALWENFRLSGLVTRHRIDFVFNPAGVVVSGLSVPQVSFAQNPWALVPRVKKTIGGKIKAAMQRSSYARAMRDAALMVFNSEYMRQAYRENAHARERQSLIVYQGISDATFEAAAELGGSVQREPMQILTVSVMAPHKGVETAIDALAILHERYLLQARLVLVGSWPDPAYEATIREQVKACHLEPYVEFRGHVDDDTLHGLYAGSRAFCLMSCCESFGIPAVEAQAFGTPVVSSDCCAIPEIDGKGGLFPGVGDVEAVAESLAKLLTDNGLWSDLSHAAVENASRYQWQHCSRPLMRMFDAIGG